MSRPPPAPVPVVPAAPVTSVRASLSPRRFALYILFASMTMLFGAVLVGFVFTRLQNPVWRTPEMAALPTGLWLSTAVLIGVSISFQAALAAARKNRSETLNRRLLLGTVLVAGFLGAQVQNWAIIHRGELLSPIRTLYPSTFYMLTGIHALHVVGGLIPLAIVIFRARRREYSSSHHEGLSLCVQYWHYLGVVWLVLFTALELLT